MTHKSFAAYVLTLVFAVIVLAALPGLFGSDTQRLHVAPTPELPARVGQALEADNVYEVTGLQGDWLGLAPRAGLGCVIAVWDRDPRVFNQADPFAGRLWYATYRNVENVPQSFHVRVPSIDGAQYLEVAGPCSYTR